MSPWVPPSPAPTPQPSTYLLIHGPVLGDVVTLGTVAGSLAEALLQGGDVVLPLELTGTGVGEGGAIHELSVFCPVIEADPAAALALDKEGTGCSCPLPIRPSDILAEVGPPQKEAQICLIQASLGPATPPGLEFRL